MRQLAVLAILTAAIGLVRAGDDNPRPLPTIPTVSCTVAYNDLGITVVPAVDDGPVKCKTNGLHLCCGSCEKAVTAILGKVDGISALKVDRKADDKVTFEAKTDKAAAEALTALVKGGFCCKLMVGDKEIAPEKQVVTIKGDSVTFTGVHICCGACVNAVKGLFKDSKDKTVTITGKGILRDVTISGKNLDGQAVLETMQKAGFTGTAMEKK